MGLIASQPQLRLRRAMIEANTGEIDPATEFADHLNGLRVRHEELATAHAPLV